MNRVLSSGIGMRSVIVLLVIASAGTTAMADENWNQFRGPRADGTSLSTELPVTFSEGSPEIIWKTSIPGRAWSSPVIWGKQIWLTNAPEVLFTAPQKPKLDKPLILSAVCVDADSGKIVHDLPLFEVDSPQVTHPTNTFASPTPMIEEGRVYLHFGAYGTACLDPKTGRKIWERRDLECNHWRGPGSSPAIYGDLLYLTFDGYDQQYITALNKLTGDNVWRRDRDIDYGTTDGDAKKAYSTPLLVHADGRDMLISPFAKATIAYDPKSGEPLWIVRHGGMNAAGRPIFGNGLAYISTADGATPMVAVTPTGSGDITDQIVWRGTKAVPKRASLILRDELLFMMNDGGIASCLDAVTGKEIWTHRFGGDYWSSPLLANGLIYCFSMAGVIPVFKADRKFELVAENKLDGEIYASPAVIDNAMIVRTKTHLYRIEKAKP